MILTINGLTARYGDHTVFKDVSFEADEGDIIMLTGINGSGKSTLIRCISGMMSYEGDISFMGSDIRSFSPAELAQRVGVLSQTNTVDYAFTVYDVVRLGRYAYRRRIFGSPDREGEDRIDHALEITGLTDMADRSVLTLSGGERQRVFLAQVIAQDPSLMILDEPTNHLDLVYQKQILEIMQVWAAQPSHAVIAAVHDLTVARAFGTKILLLSDGTSRFGEPDDIFVPDIIDTAYSMDVYAWEKGLLDTWIQ